VKAGVFDDGNGDVDVDCKRVVVVGGGRMTFTFLDIDRLSG
jgi:hypothetical protein